jgi:hypothetical protein
MSTDAAARPLVLYHGSCQDGWGAAWAAWRALGDAADYIPAHYGDPPPIEVAGRPVYILDFSYPPDVLRDIARAASPIGDSPIRVVVLDHHKTAREALAPLVDDPARAGGDGILARFEEHLSGAVMAWRWFHPGKEAPLMLRYVQDRDLWAWELELSREINAALAVEERTFARWEKLALMFESAHRFEFNWLAARGDAILKFQAGLIGRLAGAAYFTGVGGHRVPCVNSPVLQSELGEELCRRNPDSPFAAVWSQGPGDVRRWSLRSRNGFDVSAVARRYGGGGHAAAAGFEEDRLASRAAAEGRPARPASPPAPGGVE